MTALERLNAPPAPIHPSRRRAPARTAKVRSNSDTSPQDSPPKMQNKPAFGHGTAVHAPRTIVPKHCSAPQAICRRLKSHS
jgi:hypothetical protein